MTSILKGLAALVAMVVVGHGAGAHVATTVKFHQATDRTMPAPIVYERGETDVYAWLRGHAGPLPVTPEPAPAAAEPPAEAAPPPAEEPAAADPAPAVQAPLYNQPISQLPIAVHQAPPPPPAPAPPAFVIGSTQQALINQDRAGAGLPGLNWNSCLAGIAYQNALRMANQGFISHAGGANQDLGCGLGNTAGENVGYWSGGINDYQLNTMFVNSPEHRANIMGNYRFVGTSWVVARDGKAYIAVEFG